MRRAAAHRIPNPSASHRAAPCMSRSCAAAPFLPRAPCRCPVRDCGPPRPNIVGRESTPPLPETTPRMGRSRRSASGKDSDSGCRDCLDSRDGESETKNSVTILGAKRPPVPSLSLSQSRLRPLHGLMDAASMLGAHDIAALARLLESIGSHMAQAQKKAPATPCNPRHPRATMHGGIGSAPCIVDPKPIAL
jgi:hypothetical protein